MKNVSFFLLLLLFFANWGQAQVRSDVYIQFANDMNKLPIEDSKIAFDIRSEEFGDIDTTIYLEKGVSSASFKYPKQKLKFIEVRVGGYYPEDIIVDDQTDLNNISAFLVAVAPNIMKFENIYFASNEYELSPQSKQILDEYAILINRVDTTIQVIAHTDETGSGTQNLSLSQKRADAVVNYLISQGVSEDKLISIGRGEEELIVPQAKDATEHQKNRRVEFKF